MADRKLLTLVNVYAPNEDDPNFFKTLADHMEDFQKDEIIIGGDFDLVRDGQKSKKGGLPKTHNGARRTVSAISENLDLVDAWRLLNPDTCRYTWRQKQPVVHCRLDFFLVSQNFMGNVSSADILPGLKTDHSPITLNISLHSNSKGRGFWKLNSSFLTDTDHIDMIKLTIDQTQKEYRNDDAVNPSLL